MIVVAQDLLALMLTSVTDPPWSCPGFTFSVHTSRASSPRLAGLLHVVNPSVMTLEHMHGRKHVVNGSSAAALDRDRPTSSGLALVHSS